MTGRQAPALPGPARQSADGPAPRPEPAFVEQVRQRLVAEGGVPSRARVAGAVLEAGPYGAPVVLGLADQLADEMLGVGPLAPLLADPATTDIVVNGPGDVWFDRGDGLQPAPVRFPDAAAVRQLAARLAAQAGRRIDDAQPFADVCLGDGVRVHAVLPPIAADGTVLSVRVPRRRGLRLADLVASGTMSQSVAALLVAVVRARLAFLVTGGTGTGKTTLLSALLELADPAERMVVVEEVGELRPQVPHVVRLQARAANAEGAGAVTLADLVRQTLRMRPDRIVLGEARGAEIVDLMRALNSGHDGGCATLHANGVSEVPARVEALALDAGVHRLAAHSLLAAAVDVVIHLHRDANGVRRVAEIGVLGRGPDDLVRVTTAIRCGAAGVGPPAPLQVPELDAAEPPGARLLAGLLEQRGHGWPR